MARDFSIYTSDTQHNSDYNKHLDGLTKFYKRDPKRLISHLKQENYSDARIAEILKMSRQAMKRKYWPLEEE